MQKILFSIPLILFHQIIFSQLKWQNIDSVYQPLPSSVHVFFTNDRIQDTAAFRAFYIIADIKDRHLDFTTDTTYKRRLTPAQFYQKENHPLVIVNCSFFNFDQNKNLNLIVQDGKLIAYNSASLKGTGKKDTVVYKIPFRSAIGINKKRKADIAWTFTDSSKRFAYASQLKLAPIIDSVNIINFENVMSQINIVLGHRGGVVSSFSKWKMQTAVGGGPVLLQDGKIFITNEEEMMFTGKGLTDKHPRTAMGYTKDGKLIILVVQGRSESGSGASLIDEAQIFKDLGCVEALNLDGGGSSCLLVNGKETIKPSDKEGERAVPGVFIIRWN